MATFSFKALGAGALVVALISAGVALGASTESRAEESDGLPISVQVVTPTTAPSPKTEAPVPVPVDVPVSEAVFPISLSGLEPFSYIEIFANSTPVLIASGFADSNGLFTASVRLPANLPVGDHTISATNTLADGTKISTVAVAFSVSPTGLIAAPINGGENVTSALARGASNGSTTPQGTTVAEESVTGSAAAVALGPDPFNLGGVFYIGGLVAHAAYPQTAFSPAAVISFTVRNVSSEKVSAKISFSIDNALGMQVAKVSDYSLKEFAPGETREITAQVENIGQWSVYSAHMTFTPPQRVAGNTLTKISLSSGFFAFAAWVLMWALIIAFLIAAYVLGIRFLKWPTPLAIAHRIRKLFPGTEEDTHGEATSPVAAELKEPVGAKN